MPERDLAGHGLWMNWSTTAVGSRQTHLGESAPVASLTNRMHFDPRQNPNE